MKFKKYQHVERLGTPAVQGIEKGTCFVFPKIDGTNASVWYEDGEVRAGSRNRALSLENDNAGFYNAIVNDLSIEQYLMANPTHTLYGEWLVPHSLKTYREDAWRQFYVFDVVDSNGDLHMHYNDYASELSFYGIHVIAPLFIVENPTPERLYEAVKLNTYLIGEGQGLGEGVVVKNYDFVNRFGKQIWAKVVTNEFKERHSKEFGHRTITERQILERKIAKAYATPSLIEKEYAKLSLEGWESKMIPRLLETVYREILVEEMYNISKKYKQPVIDLKQLKYWISAEVKSVLPNIF